MGFIEDGQFVADQEFFAPAQFTLFDQLLNEYDAKRQQIGKVAATASQALGGVFQYFIDGNTDPDKRHHVSLSLEKLFSEAGAVNALNSDYWDRALRLTDVYEVMPQSRRSEWYEQIRNQTCPPFERDIVRDTLTSLLNMRAKFFAERVDGIFRGLSGEHVTISPAAFGKRMIVAHMIDHLDLVNWRMAGLLHDLREVIAQFMGRDDISKMEGSEALIASMRGSWGEWVLVDGGALKVKLFRKGTLHIEVHPDMAWRLNMVLAYLYPAAIPPEFRQKPKRQRKEAELIQRPIPFAVLNVLNKFRPAYDVNRDDDSWKRRGDYTKMMVKNALDLVESVDANALAEAEAILAAMGGVRVRFTTGNRTVRWQFDYHPDHVVREIITSGMLPDARSHQYYPTPEHMAQQAIELADIRESHLNLEPSAGTGGLADYMPKDRTTCVEISQLHCEVLRAKGHNVVQADFLEWAASSRAGGWRFDRIVMNPPFDSGRWQAHLSAAITLLKSASRLVAILPESAKTEHVERMLEDTRREEEYLIDWHGPYDYPGVSIRVRILVLSLTPLPF